ncbi:hypothetical protein L198_05670 [Cryptococcus wingfieldii CBS 7118]|uniref:Uncharacterized protein n=1 Tax=Cryptococcus wingfieldii CBS 7118 TaxID=1295528 RepID=A0A1E3ITY3_9TREE|nr:hypothetical protein L198_05670 [Cryptococcus wingfieldii CBS 7118]ODN91998.1 hypothetical protein L198_05670 [Cryptococcus wingfieldii CBS 7118]
MPAPDPPLPPLAALFLAHFHDTAGQHLLYYRAPPDLPQATLEHTALPSGLHNLHHDLVLFTHHHKHGAGLFRSRARTHQDNGGPGRGRTMGVVGVVLGNTAEHGDSADLFALRPALEHIYDQLEALSTPPFSAGTSDGAADILDTLWDTCRANHPDRSAVVHGSIQHEAHRIYQLVTERKTVSPEHPVAYMPRLLEILGPNIIPIYKAALSGQRILLYSPPPLLPLTALAWNIWASSIPPRKVLKTGEAEIGQWLGNVGLMDMTSLQERTGGWIATTSDVIFKSHPKIYDLFIDLSLVPLQDAMDSAPTAPPPSILASAPTTPPAPLTYAFSDLPLYRSLLLLTSSPPTVHAGLWRQGGWWLIIYQVLERAWNLCKGVCEFAVGQGALGGPIQLADGEEEARLLENDTEDDLLDLLSEADEHEREVQVSHQEPEAEPTRQGRLILRQLVHNSYHTHTRLSSVLSARPRGEQSIGQLTEQEVRELAGRWAGKDDVRFWRGIARGWSAVLDLDE